MLGLRWRNFETLVNISIFLLSMSIKSFTEVDEAAEVVSLNREAHLCIISVAVTSRWL